MAKLTKLIDYAYMKELVGLPQSIPDEEVEHPILRAQETLRMLMGDTCYQELLSQYNSNTLSESNAALLNPYIRQYLAWEAYQFWTIKSNFKFTRAGVRVHSEDNSVAASDIQMAIIIKDAKQQSQYYKMLMIDYINNHSECYSGCNCCTRNPNSGNTFHITAVRKKKSHYKRNCRYGC